MGQSWPTSQSSRFVIVLLHVARTNIIDDSFGRSKQCEKGTTRVAILPRVKYIWYSFGFPRASAASIRDASILFTLFSRVDGSLHHSSTSQRQTDIISPTG